MPHPISIVVDDEPSVRRYISTILQRQHFRTIEAEDGAHGFELVREFGNDIDLIVSDMEMPGVDGLTLARSVKASHPTVGVVLISGRALPDDIFGFVQKPFPPAALLEAVARVMEPKPVVAS